MTLNPAQQAAVNSDAALKVVIAGPGSGKTRTMVEAVRMARGKVAIMTFTNAGANEFRTRLAKFEGTLLEARQPVHCGTLHSYCFKLIQRFGGFLGYIPGKVGILPDAERIPRLLACRDKLGAKSISEKAILARKTGSDRIDKTVELIWREYEFLLKRSNLVDYDLILRVALELLGLPEVRCQIKLDYLFVDEFQDSAAIDQEIYDAIPAANKMYVGDGDQSIFGFRGAHPMGFVNLASPAGLAIAATALGRSGCTRAEVHKLELNYRSDSDICDAANDLIVYNKERVEKWIVPNSAEDGHVDAVAFEDVGQELGFIASTIIAEKNLDGGRREFAVLYRMNHDAKVCRDYLRSMGIPIHEPKWEQRPPDWERARLILALVQNPGNEIIGERFMLLDHAPSDVKRWQLEARASGKVAWQGMMRTDGLQEDKPDVPRLLAMNKVSQGTILMIAQRIELLGPGAELSDLLHDLHSNEETKENPPDGGVYVGTIHSAKGREWDVVFLPAFEQGIIPHCKPGTTPLDRTVQDLEEERRLAFVAVTRARHELYISHCEHRSGPWGKVGAGLPSIFIREMGLS